MHGLMSERPLLISAIIKHAAVYHRDTEIVSRTVEGGIHRYTYGVAERRAKRLARALLKLGIRPGVLPLLYLGHNRQPEGRALQSPFHGAARIRDLATRCDLHLGV